MTDIENLVYLSQIDDHSIFAYPNDIIPIIQWLADNGYEIKTWEAFLKTKKKIIRTLSFGSNVESPYRGAGQDVSKITKEIEYTIEDWSKSSNGSRLIICLNLRNELKVKAAAISLLYRIIAGILGVVSLGMLGFLIFFSLYEREFENILWFGMISTLICAPLFLYAAFTGKGDLNIISPEKFLKKRIKKRVKTETGQLRWPENV